jgi:hypothetical protein
MGATNHKDLTTGSIHPNVNWSQNGAPTTTDDSNNDDKFWWDADGLTLYICTDYSTSEFTPTGPACDSAGGTDFTFPNDLTITTDLSVGNDLTVTNDATITQNLTVSNNASITGDTTITGVLYAKKAVSIPVIPTGISATTGTSKNLFSVPSVLNGFKLVSVHAEVQTAGTTGTLTIDINKNGTSMLSTKLTVDSGETGSDTAATAAVIDTGQDDVSTYDVITVDIDSIHSGTASIGLTVTLEFNKA